MAECATIYDMFHRKRSTWGRLIMQLCSSICEFLDWVPYEVYRIIWLSTESAVPEVSECCNCAAYISLLWQYVHQICEFLYRYSVWHMRQICEFLYRYWKKDWFSSATSWWWRHIIWMGVVKWKTNTNTSHDPLNSRSANLTWYHMTFIES